MVIHVLLGLFVSFGKNPYATSFKGILINFWSFGIVIIAREYIRYKLINSVLKKDKKKISIIIILLFTFIEFEIWKVIGNMLNTRWVVMKRDATIQTNFVNNYNSTITAIEGKVLENTTGYAIELIQTDSIAPNESGAVDIKFNIKGSSYMKKETIKLRYCYNVDGYRRHIYLTLTIERQYG